MSLTYKLPAPLKRSNYEQLLIALDSGSPSTPTFPYVSKTFLLFLVSFLFYSILIPVQWIIAFIMLVIFNFFFWNDIFFPQFSQEDESPLTSPLQTLA